jgi:hypothetical protein
MSTVEEIEKAVSQLVPADYEKFRRWLVEFDNHVWDEEMSADAGLLGALAQEAVDEYLRVIRRRN